MSTVSKNQLAFTIHGMDCAEEVAILKRELEAFVPDAEPCNVGV